MHASGRPRRMQVEHGTHLSHLTFREEQEMQLRGARWVLRNGTTWAIERDESLPVAYGQDVRDLVR